MKKTNNAPLRERMHLYSEIRRFFAHRQVQEVETPILSPYGSTDIHIDSLTTDWEGQTLYLHTSPEFAMKRLLADGIGDCFQLCKVFRNEAHSKRHRAEFTLLEWYRLGFSLQDLMHEVAELVKTVCPAWQDLPITFLTYADAFAALGVDAHQDDLGTLKAKITDLSGYTPNLSEDRDEWLDFLLVTQVEQQLGQESLTFLSHYPASMAALARKTTDSAGNAVAERFELYYQGVELANGFYELTDAEEQHARFNADNAQRRQLGKPDVTVDTELIEALRRGLPDCAGVALGIDRLLMLKVGATDIAHVLM